MDKVYFSKTFNPSFSKDDSFYMTFFLVPNRWWSINDWKLAWSFRAEANKRIVSWMHIMRKKANP